MKSTKTDDESGTRGKTNQLENYDVEDAIEVVQELGSRLTEATKTTRQHVKHHFRQEWLDQLIARYRDRPGKPIVHLSDLPDKVIPTLSPDVRDLLRPYWEKLVSERGSMWGSKHFRCMWDIMKTGKASRWSSLRLWRRFAELTGFKIDTLEPYTSIIRAASTGTSRLIRNPKMPFNLATPEGARLIGYRGDAVHDTSAFVNKDQTLHSDYKEVVVATLGDVPFTTTTAKGIDRTNVGVLVTMLTSIAGWDNSQKQKQARNPLPAWLFLAPGEVISSCQRSVWDAEGSPTRDALKLGQSVHVPGLSDLQLPHGKRKVRISAFPRELQEQVNNFPPLLLVSSALLLYRLGIFSYLVPLRLEQTKQGKSVPWMLLVYRTINMRLFEREVGFLSPEKRKKLSRLNSLHKPKSSLPYSFRKKHS